MHVRRNPGRSLASFLIQFYPKRGQQRDDRSFRWPCNTHSYRLRDGTDEKGCNLEGDSRHNWQSLNIVTTHGTSHIYGLVEMCVTAHHSLMARPSRTKYESKVLELEGNEL